MYKMKGKTTLIPERVLHMCICYCPVHEASTQKQALIFGTTALEYYLMVGAGGGWGCWGWFGVGNAAVPVS